MNVIEWGRDAITRATARVVEAGGAVIERVRHGIEALRERIAAVRRTVQTYVLLMRVATALGHGSLRHSVSYALAVVAVTGAMLIASVAYAFTAPAAGDFGYDIYDIVVNQILNGPIGFIGGVALIVFGATKIMTNWMLTILCIIAGTILIRAADLVVTLGATI